MSLEWACINIYFAGAKPGGQAEALGEQRPTTGGDAGQHIRARELNARLLAIRIGLECEGREHWILSALH